MPLSALSTFILHLLFLIVTDLFIQKTRMKPSVPHQKKEKMSMILQQKRPGGYQKATIRAKEKRSDGSTISANKLTKRFFSRRGWVLESRKGKTDRPAMTEQPGVPTFGKTFLYT